MSTSIVIGPCRLSFFHGWEAKAVKGSTKAVFSTQVLIDINDKKNLEAVEQAIAEAREEGKAKLEGVKPNKQRNPLYDGEEEFPGDDTYKGMKYINASNTRQPEIVKKKNGKTEPILDEEEMYSGVWAFVHVNFFAYNNVGTGIGCSLQSICKVKNGPRLDSRISAEKAFEGVNFETDDDNAPDTSISPSKTKGKPATTSSTDKKSSPDPFADDDDDDDEKADDPFAD